MEKQYVISVLKICIISGLLLALNAQQIPVPQMDDFQPIGGTNIIFILNYLEFVHRPHPQQNLENVVDVTDYEAIRLKQLEEQAAYERMLEQQNPGLDAHENHMNRAAHPGMQNFPHQSHDNSMGYRGHPGMDGMYDGGNMGNHRFNHHQQNMGMQNSQFPRKDNMMNQGSQQSNSSPGLLTSYFGTSWFSIIYEVVMLVFVGGFIVNCIFGKTINDKHAAAWYNANKQYFEERYQQIGNQDDQLKNLLPQNSSPIV